jgi:hypothetical protein
VTGQTFASDDLVVAFLRAGFLSSPLFCELARDVEQEAYLESEAKRRARHGWQAARDAPPWRLRGLGMTVAIEVTRLAGS